MKKVYIILAHTGTILSRIIRAKTGAEYTHASISLDKELKQMYSFGRIYPHIAFIGGFVREGAEFGTFKRFRNTEVSIFELEVSDEQYQKTCDTVDFIKDNKDKYKFNVLGMFLAGVNVSRTKEDSFYCAEFVRYALEAGGVDTSKLPEIIKPENFKNLDNVKLIYKGLLREYHKKKDFTYYLKQSHELVKQRQPIMATPDIKVNYSTGQSIDFKDKER